MQHIKLLFWLKSKLLLRGYVKSKSEWVGTALILLIFLPTSIAMSIFAWLTINDSQMPEKAHWLELILLGIHIFWILIPILGYSLSDSYDVTKLFAFPISMRKLFVGVLLGSLLDRPVILMAPVFLAILIGFMSNPLVGLISFCALVLFLFQTLALSQSILMLGSAIFSSRKFRDTILLAIPIVWMVYYLRFMFNSTMRNTNWIEFTHTSIWQWILWLPPGWAAKAITSAYEGKFALSLFYLLGAGALTGATIYLASKLLGKVYSGDMIVSPGKAGVSTGSVESPAPAKLPMFAKRGVVTSEAEPFRETPSYLRKIPSEILAVAGKEFRYLKRDPYYKMIIINLFWPIVILYLINNKSFSSGSQFPSSGYTNEFLENGIVWGMSGLMLFSQFQLPYNIFGTEGGAVNLLFLYPLPRKYLMLGKNLFHFCLLSTVNFVYCFVVFMLKADPGLSALVFVQMEMSLIVVIGIGNLFSLYFPVRVVMKGWRFNQRNSGQGCAFTLLYLLAFFGSYLILIPVFAATILPTVSALGIGTIWLGATLPLALLYTLSLYVLTLILAEKLIKTREEAIVSKVSAEPTS